MDQLLLVSTFKCNSRRYNKAGEGSKHKCQLTTEDPAEAGAYTRPLFSST